MFIIENMADAVLHRLFYLKGEKMNLSELYKTAETIEEKQMLLEKMEKQAEKEDAFRQLMLDAYVTTICGEINKKAGKNVAKDTATMLNNLSYISEPYLNEATGQTTTILPATYAHMLFQILTQGKGYKTIDVSEVKGDVVTAVVTLHGEEGKTLGTGRVYRLVDRSSFDTPEGQNVTALNLAIGKAFANAYRDCGIGLFYNGNDDEYGKSTTFGQPAAEAPAKLKADAAAPSGKTRSKEQQVVVRPKADKNPAEAVSSVTPANDEAQKAIAPLVGYPTVDEARAMTCSISTGGQTYAEMLAMSPKAALISYRKLMAAGKKEEESLEMKACHVLVRANENIREDARRWGLESLYN